jgi:predicted nuclease of predicted toxin-antitoxin system
MKLLANENFPVIGWRVLQQAGYDIEHIGNTNFGISDVEVIELAKAENRIIITFDSDYGELVYKYNMKPPGVIYLRFLDFTPTEPALFLIDLFEKGLYQFEGLFTVISDDSIRQRLI